MQVKVTKSVVDSLEKGDTVFDSEIAGFHARRLPSGKITYGYRYRTPDGKRPMLSLGIHGEITADQARTLAKKAAGRVADDKDPAAERDAQRAQAEIDQTKTIDAILDEHIKRHVDALKSKDNVISAFRRFVRPAIGKKLIYNVMREDITDLLDDIEDEKGPVAADRTLAYLRKCFNWHMARDTKFVSPIIKGMTRTDPKERRGKRILNDEEIRDIWLAAESATRRNAPPNAPACTAQFVRLLFLTAQRRTQVACWHVDQIDRAGWMETDMEKQRSQYLHGEAWIVEAGDYKNNETQLLPITDLMRKQFVRSTGYLVSNDGGETPFSGYSKAKIAIDAEIAAMRERDGRKPIPKWTFHDIRRTARSIMSRYTTADIAERVIGHVIPGVRAVYDHYDFAKEKREALEKLASHVLGVVHADPDKVVQFQPVREPRASAG
jgi:integrase